MSSRISLSLQGTYTETQDTQIHTHTPLNTAMPHQQQASWVGNTLFNASLQTPAIAVCCCSVYSRHCQLVSQTAEDSN